MSDSSRSFQAFFAPSPRSNWTRRAYHASVVVGDYVYIDMGEVAVGSAPFSSNISNPTYTAIPINCTLTLAINQSWTDANTVQYGVITKPAAPIYDFSALWYDEAYQSLYSFGGEKSYLDIRSPDLAVWKLRLDGKGGGTWTQNISYGDPPFSQPGITRPFGGAATFTNDAAFYLGGYSSDHSSPATQSLKSFISTPGLVEYNFKDHTWSNTTTGITALSETGAFEWGGLEHVPLGPNGLLVIWGGETSNSSEYFPGAEERPMDTVTLLDPITKYWYEQNVTGVPNIPSVRNRFCSFVAIDQHPLNTINHTTTTEIYMYGGYAGVLGSSAVQYDEVWVLSLPAFTWHRIDASQKSARVGHTCHLVGGRQMLSIGGADAAQTDWWSTPDYTNLNGIGIFDLVDEQWRTGYNANGAPYERSKTVQGYYDKNGPWPRTWTQPALSDLLLHNKTTSPAPTTSTTPSLSAPTNLLPQSSSTTAPSPPHTSTTRTALIAGTTLGITFGLLLPFLFIFFYLRSRSLSGPHQPPSHSNLTSHTEKKCELGAAGRSISSMQKYELSSRRGSRVKGTQQRFVVELEGGRVAEELVGDGGGSGRGTPNSCKSCGGRWMERGEDKVYTPSARSMREVRGGESPKARSAREIKGGSTEGGSLKSSGSGRLDERGLEKSGREFG
ncbi:hypothetical protein ACLMJK_001319 [Lecanora helva]